LTEVKTGAHALNVTAMIPSWSSAVAGLIAMLTTRTSHLGSLARTH
jgi:hypothetical protein